MPDPWTAAMLRGNFETAWRVCDRVLEARRGLDCSTWPRHLQFLWDGASLEGKHVLVHCYHGLGDTIQFVRLLTSLRAIARRITLRVQPALLDLLRGVNGVDDFLALDDSHADIERDIDIELMEVLHALRLSVVEIPSTTPYLHVAPARRSPTADGALRVGLAWRAGDWRPERSVPEALLEPLRHIRSVQWFSLQYPSRPPPFAMPSLACRDIRELGRRICTLDLVICVDTMTAHLAGALGAPAWTLLTHGCDWRWMKTRNDTPWYPTMRLYRQHRRGDWRRVLESVVAGLQAFTPARDTRSVGCTASSG